MGSMDGNGNILFGKPEDPDCGGYAVMGHWRDSVCGKTIDVYLTDVVGFFCMVDTNEVVHGKWVDWKKCEPIPEKWKNVAKIDQTKF